MKPSKYFLKAVSVLTAVSFFCADAAWPAPQLLNAARTEAEKITLQKYTDQQVQACKPLGAGEVYFTTGTGTNGTVKDVSSGVVKGLSGYVSSPGAPLTISARFPERPVFPGDVNFGITGSLGNPEVDAATGKNKPTMFLVFVCRGSDGKDTEIGREPVYGMPNATDIQGGANNGTYMRVNEIRLEIVTPGPVNLSGVYGIMANASLPAETSAGANADEYQRAPVVIGSAPARGGKSQTVPQSGTNYHAQAGVKVLSPEIAVPAVVAMPQVRESGTSNEKPAAAAKPPAVTAPWTGIMMEDYTGKTFDPQGAGEVFFQMGSGTSGSLEEVSAGVQSVSGYVRSADAPLTIYSRIDERTIRPGDVRFGVQGKTGAPDIDPVTGSPKPSMYLLFVHRYPEGDPRDPIVIGSEPIYGTANPAVLKGGVNTNSHAQVNEVHLQIVVPGLVELSQVQGIMRNVEKPVAAAVAATEETSLVKPVKLREHAGETFSADGAGDVWFDNVTGTNGSVSKNADGGISVSGHIAAPNAPLVVYRLNDAVLDVVKPGDIVIGFKGQIFSADPLNPAKPKPAMYITFYSAANGVYKLLGRERILGDIVPDTLKVAVNNGTYTKVKKVQLEIADAAGEVNFSNIVGLIREIKAAAPILSPDDADQRVRQ